MISGFTSKILTWSMYVFVLGKFITVEGGGRLSNGDEGTGGVAAVVGDDAYSVRSFITVEGRGRLSNSDGGTGGVKVAVAGGCWWRSGCWW